MILSICKHTRFFSYGDKSLLNNAVFDAIFQIKDTQVTIEK